MLQQALKILKKTQFSAKVILRYFQKYTRYESNVIWGPKHIPWTQSEAITKPLTISTGQNPLTFSQQLPFFGSFRVVFTYSLG